LFVKPNPNEKIILLLDGHTRYSRNIEALELAKANGIILLQLPGHTTHRLQPLDVSFFKPLQTFYNYAVEKWLRANPGLGVTQYQVSHRITKAYGKAATIENAAGGFRGAGIWPVDRYIFKEYKFAASQNLQDNPEPTSTPEPPSTPEPSFTPEPPSTPESPSTPGQTVKDPEPCTSKSTIPMEQFYPIPKSSHVNKRMKKGSQHAVVLTSTPNIEKLKRTPKRNPRGNPKAKKVKCSLALTLTLNLCCGVPGTATTEFLLLSPPLL
jgi:hypothetical protein